MNNPKGDNLTLTGGGGFSTRMILSTFIRNLFPGACVFMIFFSGISRVHVFFGISILAGYIYIYIFFLISPLPLGIRVVHSSLLPFTGEMPELSNMGMLLMTAFCFSSLLTSHTFRNLSAVSFGFKCFPRVFLENLVFEKIFTTI